MSQSSAYLRSVQTTGDRYQSVAHCDNGRDLTFSHDPGWDVYDPILQLEGEQKSSLKQHTDR